MARAMDKGIHMGDALRTASDLATEAGSHAPPEHDGMPTCALCADTDPTSTHDWCDVSHALVCRRCCERVSGFDPDRLLSAFGRAAHVLTPDEVAHVCASCPNSVADPIDADPLGADSDPPEA